LPRCKNRSSQTGTVSLPQVTSVIVAKDSPLSSAETLTELPTELKRTLSSRLTRALLHSRGRDRSRASTIASVTSLPTTESSEFGEAALLTDKSDNITERGRFGFLKKSKAARARPPSLSGPFTSDINSSADSFPSPRLTNSPDSISHPSSTTSQHRRVSSSPAASSKPKLRIADKICPRKEKDKDAEPRPKPARTQPYGPPYNWIPPAPGAWAVATDDTPASGRRRKRLSEPTEPTSSHDPTRHGHDRIGSVV